MRRPKKILEQATLLENHVLEKTIFENYLARPKQSKVYRSRAAENWMPDASWNFKCNAIEFFGDEFCGRSRKPRIVQISGGNNHFGCVKRWAGGFCSLEKTQR